MQAETRKCQNCKVDFTVEPEDIGFYEKINVPLPTWCPRCRLRRRMAWTAYRTLYKTRCAHTGEEVITFYHPDSPYTIYKQDIWWSDSWEPRDYGFEYNLNKPFFEQFESLLKKIPLPSLHTDYASLVNSPYCNGVGDLKNCYLCFQTGVSKKGLTSEDCAYAHMLHDSKDCFDMSFSGKDELCYEGLNITGCYQVFFSQNCEECHNMYFSENCVGCSDCIGCVNLRKKQYHIFNEQYSKEDYEEKLKGFDFGSYENVVNFRRPADAFMLEYPRKEFYGRKNVTVTGDYMLNSKETYDSYIVYNTENSRYLQIINGCANSYDYTLFGVNAELMYETCWSGINTNTIKFSFWNYFAHHLEYCFGCHSSENLFGCVGIRKGSYCILNKQYSKNEYGDLVGKIKEQMHVMPYVDALGREYRYGEFFPSELCPWTYNESIAYDFLPLKREEAIRQGFAWRDSDEKEYQNATVTLPDHIKDTSDDILNEILKCGSCGKNYRLIAMELVFYKRFNLPVPRNCFACRDRARIQCLNPIELYDRECDKCKKAIRTPYSPHRKEIVYCEQCYQAEVV